MKTSNGKVINQCWERTSLFDTSIQLLSAYVMCTHRPLPSPPTNVYKLGGGVSAVGTCMHGCCWLERGLHE